MTMIHINARSLINKFDEIKNFLCTFNWYFIFVSETWFNKNEAFYSLDSYNLFSTSRTNKPGGGSAIYVRDDIEAKQINVFKFTTAEAVFLKINKDKQKTCLMIQIYRAPRNNLEFLSELEQCLVQVTKLNMLTYIVGDFNADLFSISENSFCSSLFTTMCSFGFLPAISKASRVSKGSITLIDNIYCNDISMIDQSGVIKTDFSDHFSIFSSSNISLEKNLKDDEVRATFDYKNLDEFKEFLQNELENFQSETDPENACNLLIDAYAKGIAKFSKIKQSSRKKKPIQPWITPALLHSINRKNMLFSEKLRNPNAQNVSKYNAYRNCLNTALRNAKKTILQGRVF